MALCEEFEYSRHAEDRLRERQIQKEYIRAVFREGCSDQLQDDGRHKIFGTLRGRTLVVVVKVVRGKQCFVLRAYWSRSLN